MAMPSSPRVMTRAHISILFTNTLPALVRERTSVIETPEARPAFAVLGVTTVAPLQKNIFFGLGSTSTNFFLSLAPRIVAPINVLVNKPFP